MIRRLFRTGLWLGLIGGIALALIKLLRPPSDDIHQFEPATLGGEQWRPLAAPAPTDAAPDGEVSENLADVAATEPPAVESMEESEKDEPTAAAAADRVAATWVDPDGNVCPESHPIKGNAQSKIFHVPGGLSYDRTIPERCYESAEAAEADGFRRAKR